MSPHQFTRRSHYPTSPWTVSYQESPLHSTGTYADEHPAEDPALAPTWNALNTIYAMQEDYDPEQD